MKNIKLFFLVLLITNSSIGQVSYNIKIMSWNILNWPDNSNLGADTTLRCPAYRAVVNHVNPDILVTMENTATNSVPLFLNQVMNYSGSSYRSGTFINGYDTDNGIFYRDSLFDFISNVPIHTALRDISHFSLIFTPTGDTIHIFAVHLKASQGYENERAAEVANLRNVTNAFHDGVNFLVAGDFNIYDGGEPCYTALLQDNPGDDGNFNDVWAMQGIWNDPSYAPYHTQSTRYSGGTGSGGGMDDRFDLILYSNAIAQQGGMSLVPGTYTNIGNDGNHYNNSVNYGTNSAVPMSVANALYDASDHLPVSLNLFIQPVSVSEEESVLLDLNIFPMPVTGESQISFSLKKNAQVQFTVMDVLGQVVFNGPATNYPSGSFSVNPEWLNDLKSGYYSLLVKYNNSLINKKIVIIN